MISAVHSPGIKEGTCLKEVALPMDPKETARLVNEWKSQGILLRNNPDTGSVELGAKILIRKDRANLNAVGKSVGLALYGLKESFYKKRGYAVSNPYALGICTNVEMGLVWDQNGWKLEVRAAHLSGSMNVAYAKNVADDFSRFVSVIRKGLDADRN
ncbi:MAG: hypothetical protein KGH66_02040 [Candidatus Micrarchaeota archaeon]|nr:hypothetical protein [Candidatus Micrarchaeota archaeon]